MMNIINSKKELQNYAKFGDKEIKSCRSLNQWIYNLKPVASTCQLIHDEAMERTFWGKTPKQSRW